MNLPRAIWLTAAGFAAAAMVSCASDPARSAAETKPAAVWPSPPDEARIGWLKELRGPNDIGQQPSLWHTVANWVTGDAGESLKLHKPFSVALDEAGNLCLTDTDDKLVIYADLANKKWRRFTAAGKTAFAMPVAVAKRNGIFYVADSSLEKVFAFSADGRLGFEIGTPLKRPVGLAVTTNRLFVVDALAHAVFAFGLDGKYQFTLGQRGTGPGEFNFPTCAAVDGQGRLLVTDTMNCRVQIFDAAGTFLSQFGTSGDTSGHFARPKGVATDAAGRIYVVDAVFDNFQIFSPEGRLLLHVGQHGGGAGGFGLPSGIAISADNQIYVADTFNRRVQVFKYIGPP